MRKSLACTAVVALLACTAAVASDGVKAAGTQSQTTVDSAATEVALKDVKRETLRETLLAQAREFLEHRNQNLIAGARVGGLDPSYQISAALSARSLSEEAALRDRAARLNALGEAYTGFATDVRLVHARNVEGKLVARIEEATELYRQVSGDEPPSSGFRVEREFVFEKDAVTGWILEDVQYVGEGPAPINEVVENGATAALARPPLPTSAAPTDSSPLRTSKTTKYEWPVAVASAYYNRNAMVNYATTYVYNYNNAYRTFPNDCTNFISQAMYAGGWTMVSGYYTSNDVWWYNWLNQSYTWAGAHNWYFFARGSGRTSSLSSVWNMQLGDVLQIDFQRDGQIDHTMIVTWVGTSDLYLTYHTNDNLNRSLQSIIDQYPNAWYYAHRMS